MILSEKPGEKVDVFSNGKGRVQVFAQPLRHVSNTGQQGVPDSGIADIFAKNFDAALLDFPGT